MNPDAQKQQRAGLARTVGSTSPCDTRAGSPGPLPVHVRGVKAAPSLFTARETQVLQSIADGLSCRDMARRLGISEGTVRKHRSNMLAKLGVRNAAQLVAHARVQGWLAAARVPQFRGTVGARA